jgi:hypothetical protein
LKRGAVGKHLDFEAGFQQMGSETVDVDGAGRGGGEQAAGLVDDVAQGKLAGHVGAAGADAQAGVGQRGFQAQSTARGLRGLVQRRGPAGECDLCRAIGHALGSRSMCGQ